MHGEEVTVDNMIKVGYAVISADWQSADRSYFSDCNALLFKLCRSSCYLINNISIHKVKVEDNKTQYWG